MKLSLRLGLFLGAASAVLAGRAPADLDDTATSSPEAIVPAHDPADQPFRFAPLADGARSVVLRLGPGTLAGFDTALCRWESVWVSAALDLYGPPYSRAKLPFICKIRGRRLWRSPVASAWRTSSGDYFNAPGLRARFRSLIRQREQTALTYDLVPQNARPAEAIAIVDTPTWDGRSLTRKIRVGPAAIELRFLALADLGSIANKTARGGRIDLASGEKLEILAAPGSAGELELGETAVDYWQPVVTEPGTESAWQKERIHGTQARVEFIIAPHQREETVQFSIRPVSGEAPDLWAAGSREAAAGGVKPAANGNVSKSSSSASVYPANLSAFRPETGDSFYRIEHFPIPKPLDFLVGGMDWMPNGDLAVCTWPGDVYIVEGAQGPVKQARFRRFARGLMEPLGLKVVDGDIYVSQKSGLLRLRDTDGDGQADRYDVVSQAWGFAGNYHSFVFGPAVDSAKDFYLLITGNHGRWDLPYQGWCVKISPDGTRAEGICDGLRVPNGVGFFQGDLFCTDNEGNWLGACKLNHLQRGKFYGFPSSSPTPRPDPRLGRQFEPPALWFPRELAPSACDFAVINTDQFGPFRGQLVIGDFQTSILMRAALEKVNDRWQGAVWPMTKGFLSAVNRVCFGPDGKLYVGGCRRTWAGGGPLEYCLDRVRFSGKQPFAIRRARALPDGFLLEFTAPADAGAAGDKENYSATQFGYYYRAKYGSPEIDQQGNPGVTDLNVESATVSADGRAVRLRISGWKTGFVTAVRAVGLRSAAGQALWHETFYYTLNEIPTKD